MLIYIIAYIQFSATLSTYKDFTYNDITYNINKWNITYNGVYLELILLIYFTYSSKK